MSIWRELLITLAIVALTASIWAQLTPLLLRVPRWLAAVAVGAIAGLGAIGSIISALEFAPGVLIDLRNSLIAVAALAAGLGAGILGAAIAALYRVWQGGVGAPTAVVMLFLSALIGALIRRLMMRQRVRRRAIFATAIAVAALTVAGLYLQARLAGEAASTDLVVATAALIVISVLMVGLTIRQATDGAWDTHMLREALAQAPNFFYVKNRHGRIVAANRAVAHHHGFKDPEEVRGLTDFDLAPQDRAQALHEAEQALMAGDLRIDGVLERIEQREGGTAFYETSKVALRDPRGEVIGLTGVTVDVTQRKRLEEELRHANALLETLAGTDALTGLPNRRSFDAALQVAFGQAIRSGRTLSLLMIDVDSFKAYNDRYGHPQGDECLRLVAESLRMTLHRPEDVVARYGGEEFAALLPDTGEEGALVVAERFRKALEARREPHGGSNFGFVTASVGVACTREGVDQPTQLVRMADEALYRAKSSGRNAVAGPPQAQPSSASA